MEDRLLRSRLRCLLLGALFASFAIFSRSLAALVGAFFASLFGFRTAGREIGILGGVSREDRTSQQRKRAREYSQ